MRTKARRRIILVASVLGGLILLVVLAYEGGLLYLQWREKVSPSTSQVLVLRNGTRIPLVQPSQPSQQSLTPQPAARGEEAVPEPDGIQTPAARQVSAAPTPGSASGETEPFLPPLSIKIPGIGVDRQVVLSTNDNLPRFKGIGWLLGSAFPGRLGNMVLFGHLDGPYATFGRLRELGVGAVFSVFTSSAEYQYRVESTFDVDADDVSVLAPTTGATATLFTCSGLWDPVKKVYSQRHVVVASYVGELPLVPTPIAERKPTAP